MTPARLPHIDLDQSPVSFGRSRSTRSLCVKDLEGDGEAEMPETRAESRAIIDVLAVLTAVAFAVLGLIYFFGSPDGAMSFHGLVFAVAAGIAAMYVMSKLFSTARPPSLTDNGNGQIDYFDGPTKFATIAAVFWGVAGFLIGDIIAWQLAFPVLNFEFPWTSFGRLRPLHTSAVIFAFGGNVLLATSFYVVQRTSHARLAGAVVPLVCCLWLQSSDYSGWYGLSARNNRRQGIRRTRMVC